MRRRLAVMLAAGLLIMGLAGCGENQIPEMTDEEMQLLGEYTAMTLMKYDANNRSRLVDYSHMLIASQPNTEQEQVFQEPQVPEGMDPVDDTPIVGGPAGASSAQSYSIEDALGLPEGVSIVYAGQTLQDAYPEDALFTVSASEGKQLLVLEFIIINESDQDQAIDMPSLGSGFRITVNGDYSRDAMFFTGLEMNLPEYQETIPSMGRASAVLMIELDDERAANLESISLSLKNESKMYTIQLL